jgi:uncharacterized membrane protein
VVRIKSPGSIAGALSADLKIVTAIVVSTSNILLHIIVYVIGTVLSGKVNDTALTVTRRLIGIFGSGEIVPPTASATAFAIFIMPYPTSNDLFG